jgi:MFS family permease
VGVTTYRAVLAHGDLRAALVFGLLLRIPQFAVGVILTLHVVDHLGRSWTEAGAVAAVGTVAIAVSQPWRGRLLDRVGLRRVLVPSLVVLTLCWSVAPFASYWVLLGLAGLAGLFAVPTFSIIRQAVIAAVPDDQRRTALSLDSVVVEVAFVAGPVGAIWLTTWWETPWVLLTVQLLAVGAGLVLYAVDLPMHSVHRLAAAEDAPPVRRRAWLGPRFVALCAVAFATLVVLIGSEVALVAAVRELGQVPFLGVVLAGWGLGSILGGLVYGAWPRALSPYLLLAALGALTVPMALGRSVGQLGVLALVAGLVCAPTITATVDDLSRVVPERARGEAMGWHGSAMTAGSAAGAPMAGMAIDVWGASGGFVVVGAVGVAVAAGAVTVVQARRAVLSRARRRAV